MSTKAVVINDEWIRRISGAYDAKINTTDKAYAKIPLIYRATKLRCDSLVRVPIHVFQNGNEVEEWPFEQSLKKIIWQTEASHLLRGGAVWVKLRNRADLDKGVQVLNPFTVDIQLNERTGERTFIQTYRNQTKTWPERQIVFWREYSPLDDIGWGTAAAEVALGDSQIMHYLSRFQLEFFKSGAQPAVLLGLEDATPQEVERAQGWFSNTLQGVQKAWRVLALRGKINPQVLTPPFKDMALPDVRSQAFGAVVQAFGVPETMLMGNSANYATATQDKETYIADTIAPRCTYYQDGLNEFLEPTGISIKFGVNELTEMQEDETMRAGAFASYVNAGMPEEVARAILGIDIPEDVQGVWDEFLARKKKQADTPPPSKPIEDGEQEPSDEAMMAWRRKALKRFDEGKSPNVSFVSPDLKPEQVEAVKLKLSQAITRDDVLSAFSGEGKSMVVDDLKKDIEHLKLLVMAKDGGVHLTIDGDSMGEKIGEQVGAQIKDAMRLEQPITVNVPQQLPPVVNITMPEQAAPIVNVSTPAVTVNVPKQDAPRVDVHVPEQRPRKVKVARDREGRIKEITE